MSRVSSTDQSPPGEAFERFKSAMRDIVSIPKAEIERRAKAWAKKRGRKRKR
jgi:hypothetical protein